MGRGAVAAARFAGEVGRGVVLGLAAVWGVGYGLSLLPRLEHEAAFGWFCVAAILFVFAGTLVQAGADRARIDCAGWTLFRTAGWLSAAGMLAWMGQHAFELYERVAPVPLWVDRVSEIAYFVAPAPAGVAVYLLFADGLRTSLSRRRQARQPELTLPGGAGCN